MNNITTINLDACPLQYLSIGYVGETGARPVAFDFSAWATEYGAGVLQLLLQRPGDAEPYRVLLDIDGTTATWTPDATATEKTGQGQAQLVYTVGGVVVKNAIFRVLIAPSLGAAGNPPEPYEDWLQRLTALAAQTQQSALDAAGSATEAEQSAGAAAGNAGAAAQSALDAEAAKTDADAAARVAGQSATLAGEKAAQAAQSAQAAAQKATDAQQSAEDTQAALEAARLAADAAETFKDDAQTAAAGANQAKTDAQRAAAAAAGSAAAAAAAVTEVETKGAQQITAIGAAGTDQITAVGEAGASQVQAVEEKGEKVLESIQADYSELIADVVDLKSSLDTKAPAIYETVGPATTVSFTDGADNAPIELLTADLCDQNLHGYDHPWAAGHGINMLPPVCNNSDFTLDENGAYSQNNTSSAGWPWTYSRNVVNVTVQPGTYTVSFHAVTITDGNTAELRVLTSTGSLLKIISGSNKQTGSATFTVDAETTIGVCIKCYKGVWKLQLEEGSTASDWTPYENVCPMAGTTSIDISVSGADTTTPTVTHIAFVDPETEDPITVHGGILAIDSNGMQHIDICQYYESYNGETLVGPWRSSIEAYDPEATPTVGAQVVDYGSVIKSFSLAGNPIHTLYGENNIWSSTGGNIIVRYLADSELYIEEAMKVKDVQVDGASVVSDGVANVPLAMFPSSGTQPGNPGVVMLKNDRGIRMDANDHSLYLQYAQLSIIKPGGHSFVVITPAYQHYSAFYGLAKIAGYDEKNSTLPAGQYTENAKSAIHEMLNGSVEVTGTTPVITALPGIRYVCGEVATLDVTLPASGCIDVIFESGSTSTVLTVTPPTGVTVRWANGFDPNNLEANTMYEINILDGLGVAMTWT